MKSRVFAILAILAAAALFAGCTSTPPAPPVTTQVTVPVVTTIAVPVPTAQPSFSLGDHYLQKPYTFNSESDVFTEQFYVDDPSWGIDFTVKTLNDNLNYCWFTMDVTDVNTEQTEHYGYGREFAYETDQKIPMYKAGPYKIVMKGNRVRVVVTAAKRFP